MRLKTAMPLRCSSILGETWERFDAGELVMPFGEKENGQTNIMTIAGIARVPLGFLEPDLKEVRRDDDR
jgi:hypothetical protein